MAFRKAFIFGAGVVGQWLLPYVKKQYQVVAFLDNDKTKQGNILDGIPVHAPELIKDEDYDIIIIASRAGINTITEQLNSLGVTPSKIHSDYVNFSVKARAAFLDKLGELFRDRCIRGCVAECGVFMGEFAQEINRVFPDSKLYLFDTFSGFDERDLAVERSLSKHQQGNQYSNFKAGHFNITREDIVLKNLPHPEKCVICKGYFPETTIGVADQEYCFVNLDFDLYQPTLAGLNYFYPRMAKGGVILIHDYFSGACRGVQRAVKEFEEAVGDISLFPIGDGLSVGFTVFR